MSHVTRLISLLSSPVGAPLTVLVLLAALTLMAVLGRVPFRYNVRNLVTRWPTTLMTALAFTAVIGLWTGMQAFVNGMNRLTENSGHPENVILLSPGSNDEVFSNLAFTDMGDIENQPGIARDAEGRPLCSKETYIIINQPLANPEPGRPKRRFVQLRGIDNPDISAAAHHVDLFPGGQWFSQAGVRSLEGAADPAHLNRPLIEAVVGEGVARLLGRDRSPAERAQARDPQRLTVGDQFTLGDRQWVVVGVMRSSGLTFDSEIWAKRGLVGPMFGKETYTSLVLRTEGVEAAKRLKQFFSDQYGKAALQPLLETEYYNGLSATNQQFSFAVAFVAIVMAFGGVVGVMNTMFAAISQRTKDIGVLRLLGYGRRQILISFLLESLLIALVGGLLGCALGSLTNGWTANSIVGSGQGGGKSVVLKLVVDQRILAQGLLLTIVMGCAGGLLPAFRAVRLKALESLR